MNFHILQKGKSREHKENSKDTEGTEKAGDDENEKDSDDDEENKQENDNDNDSTSTKENNMAESNKSAEQFQENNNNNSSETEKINQLATKLESLVVEEKQQEQHQEEQQKEQQEQQENAAKSDQELEKTQNEDPIEQSEQEEIFYPPNSLEACLASFFVKELLTDSEKYGCSNCFKLRNKKLAQNDEDEQSEKEDEGKGEEENEEEKEKEDEEEEEKKESKNKVVGKNGLKKTLAPPSVIYSDATKQFLLKSAPLYICIHLKRFQQIGLRLQKDDRNIVFPFVLDLSKFMANTSSNGSSNIYDLYAVVVHQGGIGSGHYVSYVKVLSNDLSTTHGWYFTSDSHVSAVDESTVQKAQAFLLFYQKRVE